MTVTGRPRRPVPWRPVAVPGSPRLAAERTGRGSRPVLAVHGMAMQHRCFSALARHLRHPDGVLAFDLSGRGATPATSGHAGLDAHVGDVIRVLDAAGVDRTVLIGHSMGAYIVERVALLHPSRVAGIILVDGGWPLPGPFDWLTPGAWNDAVAAGRLMRAASQRLRQPVGNVEGYAAWWAGVAGESPERPSVDTLDLARHDLRRNASGWEIRADPLAAAGDAWLLPLQAPSARQLAGIECPVVLVHAGAGVAPGEPPLIGSRQLRALRRALNLRDIELSGATHYSIILGDNAAELARAVDGLAVQVLAATSHLGRSEIA